MRGEVRPVWSELWAELRWPLAEHDRSSPDVYCGMAVAFNPHLAAPAEYAELATLATDPSGALHRLDSLSYESFPSELAVVACLDSVYEVCGEFSDELAEVWLAGLRRSSNRFGLRYVVTDFGQLRLSASAVAAGLMGELEQLAMSDPAIAARLADIADSLQEAVADPSERRIRNALREEILLLELLGGRHSATRSNTLGGMCAEFGSWPHGAVQKALEALYGFSSDYPGFRHSGSEVGSLRPIDLRDLAALTTVFLGFVPYVTDGLPLDAGLRSLGDLMLGTESPSLPEVV